MKEVAGIIAFVLIVGLVVGCKVSFWNECRAMHSWTYCMNRK